VNGWKYLVFAGLIMAAMVGAACALDQGETTVSANVPQVIEFSVSPATLPLTGVTPGSTASATNTLSVSANVPWKLSWMDSSVNADGHMHPATGSSHPAGLTGAFTGKFDSVGTTYWPIPITKTQVDSYVGLTGSNVQNPLFYQQPIAWGDYPQSYSIIVSWIVEAAA
jgi:hypothetical protein